MPEISNITIKNIKGFMDHDNSFDVHIIPQKINLLIAPNGFGKSSITKAFESLNENRLNLDKEYYHDEKSPTPPEISIIFDDRTLIANQNENNISQFFNITVINSRLKANAKINKFGNQIRKRGELEIEDIVLKTSIPNTAHIEYELKNIQYDFGKNKKIISNLSDKFSKRDIAEKIISLYPLLHKLTTAEVRRITKEITEKINNEKGSKQNIIDNIDNNIFSEIEALDDYIKFQNEISDLRPCNTPLSKFETFIQIKWLYENKRKNLLDTKRYDNYINIKEKYNQIIKSINTTGQEILAKEENKKLKVSFPKANTISNGQRDILTFIINLYKFEMNYDDDKNNLLIIDEVFDYLDDANIVAAQYFLSKFLSINKNKFYLIIFSHLSKENFRGWVLNKKINTQYIKPVKAKPNINTKVFISYRDYLKKTDNNNYSNLSNYYFHYNPNTKEQDLSAAYKVKEGLKPTWFKGTNLHNDIIPELNKYLSGKEEYDPYAVCFALRFKCEKDIYSQLEEDKKLIFLNEKKKTKDKLEYAEELGVDVPIIYYMLGIIFNEAEHLTGQEIAQNKERSCVYKLDNLIIRQMAKELFEYQGNDITINDII